MLLKFVVLFAAVLTVAVSAPSKSDAPEPSDIWEVAEWLRPILLGYVDSQKVERVYDDSITIYDYAIVYKFKMDVSVKRKDDTIYITTCDYIKVSEQNGQRRIQSYPTCNPIEF